MKPITKETMPNKEVIRRIQETTKFNHARKLVRFGSAAIERSNDSIDHRRQEFEIVRKILALYGVEPE